MDWNKVNWFTFFPPLFSIYLLFISGVMGAFLAGRVKQAAGRGAAAAHEDFIRNTASGWAAQLGFMNAMLASFVSTISVWSASGSFAGLAVTFFVLLLVFAPMLWYVLSHEPDQIVATKLSWAKISPATFCKLVLLLVNVGLIVAIAWGQQLSPPK